ncbi:MAG TPA: TIGR03619 family F420-dependent LLM class oxidoreductase [Candidatus Limnocylindrales bacterium]|nr:TIGR03619 family F420-dependent LLM class oxidoreductase [Candidatus Limnocylindrales bacterium]
MKIGFGLPVSGSWATREHMARVAVRAEQLGYHSLWSFQRLLSPGDGAWGEQYRSVHAPLIPLAYAAALTERVRLGVAVVNLPFVNPAVLAKEVSSLDVVSGFGGRVDLGLGIGWSDEEFTATGVAKRGRGRRSDDFLRTLKAVWADEAYSGRYYTVPPGVASDPKPLQRPHPPILLGGGSEATFKRAGLLCEGWVSGSQMGPEVIGAAVLAVRAAAQEAGRDPAALRFVARGAVKVRPAGSPERKPLTGTIDEIRADLESYEAIGVTELFVDLNFDPEIGSPTADPEVSMRRAEQALEAFAP